MTLQAERPAVTSSVIARCNGFVNSLVVNDGEQRGSLG